MKKNFTDPLTCTGSERYDNSDRYDIPGSNTPVRRGRQRTTGAENRHDGDIAGNPYGEAYQPSPVYEGGSPMKEANNLMGIHLGGTVVDRTRRMVPRDNPTTEIITYTLETDGHRRYFVDDYAPTEYYERGDYILVPVYVKPYRKRNNDLSYTLCILKEYQSSQGESF